MKTDNNRLNKTAGFLKQEVKSVYYPCHCTDFNAKHAIAKQTKVEEVFVSKIISV